MNPTLKTFLIACGAVVAMHALQVNGIEWQDLVPVIGGDDEEAAA